MRISHDGHKKKTAMVIVNNEIILNALKKILESRGYEVRQDIECARNADFGLIGAYFAFLGIVKQLRAANSSLPLVLVVSAEHEADGNGQWDGEFYDVITLESHSEADIRRRIERWFEAGRGKVLLEKCREVSEKKRQGQ